jgi:hypothetical protein
VFGVSAGFFLDDVINVDGNYMIAIDGGGTKTEFILYSEDGNVVARQLLSGTNPNVCGIDKACKTLKSGIDALLCEGGRVNIIYAGIAGAYSGKNKANLLAYLKKQYPLYKIKVESDVMNVVGLSEDGGKCTACIVGTGAEEALPSGISLFSFKVSDGCENVYEIRFENNQWKLAKKSGTFTAGDSIKVEVSYLGKCLGTIIISCYGIQVNDDGSVTVPEPTLDGYRFLGWHYDKNLLDLTKVIGDTLYTTLADDNTLIFNVDSTHQGEPNTISGFKILKFCNKKYIEDSICGVDSNLADTTTYSYQFTKVATFNQLKLALNAGAYDSNYLVDISHLEDGKEYTLSFSLDEFDADAGTAKVSKLMIEEGLTATKFESCHVQARWESLNA